MMRKYSLNLIYIKNKIKKCVMNEIRFKKFPIYNFWKYQTMTYQFQN